MSESVDALKNQLQQLKALFDAGVLTEDNYKFAKDPLERRLVDAVLEAGPVVAPVSPASAPLTTQASVAARPPIKLVAAVLAFVTVVGVGGYMWRGQPEGWHVGPTSQTGDEATAAPSGAASTPAHDMSAQQIAELTERLAQRMEQDPNNAQGWAMLARSYAVLNRYPEAVKAYKRYTDLQPKDAQAWADYADALGMANKRSLEGEPAQLIAKALQLDPDNFKALALSGSLAFAHKDYAGAVRDWEHALQAAPPNAELAQQLQGGLDEARKLGGIAAPVAAPMSAAVPAPAAAPSATVSGTVSLAAGLQGRAAPEDTVFIFARAVQGPRMPLAILRKQVKDLPIQFSLDDSLAMSPQMRLSTAQEVVIGARVSKSGNAMPQAGDLEGVSAPVKIGARHVSIEISRTVP